jgi:hypothetical protein
VSYPNRQITIDALLNAARSAAESQKAEHPEDIAHAMMNAIEYGWPMLVHLHERGVLDNPDPNVVP